MTWTTVRHVGVFTMFAALTFACSTLPAASATQIGCDTDEMEITNVQNGPSGDTWTVACHGHVWDCARSEEPFEASAWDWAALQRREMRGTMKGDTYCLQRED